MEAEEYGRFSLEVGDSIAPCAYLAGALLFGLLGNALVGAWWLDPVVGLLIAALAVKEGLEAWRDEGCCVAPAFPAREPDDCDDDCCA
jgi:hypothetical protein